MIKQLQRRFVLIAMGSLLLVIMTIIGLVNGINYYQINQQADHLLNFLSEHDGEFPTMDKEKLILYERMYRVVLNEESKFSTRYFTVKLDHAGQVWQIDTSNIAAISDAAAEEYAMAVMENRVLGRHNGIYKYLIEEKPYGTFIAFVDCSMQVRMHMEFLWISLAVALFSLLVMFMLVYAFSNRAIQPVIDSMERQKQFITDAGHEIKTPLAIISANTEVLELVEGSNEWTTSIRNQTKRLTGLVEDLLSLAKVEEQSEQHPFMVFSLSDTVEESGEQFIPMAEQQEKTLVLDIHPNLQYNGNEQEIYRLVMILTDNAVKYANPGGQIKITLKPAGKHHRLEVYNTCNEISQKDLSHLFDRFYRADNSRSRETGGYGIGLSLAKAIVERHKAKIQVTCEDNRSITFTVIL